MALIEKLRLKNGVNLEDAYCKIEECRCTNEKITYCLYIYYNKEYRNKNAEPVETEYYECCHDTSECSTNCIKQGYNNLKTLDKFKNAIDDLED